MQLLGQTVNHRTFGMGVVTNVTGSVVTIQFTREEKRFLYPEGFLQFLTLEDAEQQQALTARHTETLEAEEEARTRLREARELRRKNEAMPIKPNTQAAFHVASADVSTVLETATVSTGVYLSGITQGRPRIPNRLKANSACLITTLPEGGEEGARVISGVFMVPADFQGGQCLGGEIAGHETYRLALPADAALPYWPYLNQKPPYPRWGKVAFKYFSNTDMQAVLRDMAARLKGTQQETAAAEFYRYFCEINRLPEEVGA